MNTPHYIRILVTNRETDEYMRNLLKRNLEGQIQARELARSIGATAFRLNFEDRPYAFDGFETPPDKRFWRAHKRGGYCLREKVAKAHQQKRDELAAKMQAIQIPWLRTLTSELFGDLFVLHYGQNAYYLKMDDLTDTASPRFIISYPVASRYEEIPEKAAAWGQVIKESRYHELLEWRDEAVNNGGAK